MATELWSLQITNLPGIYIWHDYNEKIKFERKYGFNCGVS